MKIKEIRDLNIEEIKNKIVEKKKEVMELKIKHSMRSLEKPSFISQAKRDIAKLLTILKEKQKGESK